MRTENLIDQLADLAAQRSLDRLDQCFMELVDDMVAPQSLAVHHATEVQSSPHWVSRGLRASVQPPPVPLDALPLHCEAWDSGQIVEAAGSPATMLVPLGTDDDVHSLIEIRTAGVLRPDQRRFVRAVQRFYRQLRGLMDENERDSLTRLLNRKSFDETFVRMALQMDDGETRPDPLDAEPDRRVAAPASCWLGVVDIDHFKKINDTHGHLIGDEVLILVARQMQQCFRRQDRLYRFGGEEFVVLLRCGSADQAGQAFERLRATIEAFEFPQVGHLTVSVGYTEIQSGDTPGTAFQRADLAVYEAKGAGRNRVVCHESLVEDGAIETCEPATGVEFF